ncbi:MAG: integrase [Bdellovibrio sp.]|nr:MAG: integrase [Bdellovibrio sp.]
MLPLWVEFFEDLQTVRGRSANTVMAYRRDLELYESFKSHHRPVMEFFDFMKGHHLSVRSQARVISSVRTYMRFCETHGMEMPELTTLRPPKVNVKLPKTLTLEEFDKLMKACETEDQGKTLRNKTTLLLLYGVGCRVSELIGLDLIDFSATDHWVKILGKGNKERIVPLTENLAEQLRIYLVESRPQLLREERALPSLLVNDRGHRPSRVDVWRWLAAWSAKAGFSEPVNPHRFRHACATSLLEGGADLRSIQLLLGHSSIQTTQVYTSVTTQSLVRTVDDHHPLAQIKDERKLE